MGAYTPRISAGDPERQASYTGTLVADRWDETGITLPSSGWIYLVGSGLHRHFSFRIPVADITAQTPVSDGDETATDGVIRFFIGNAVSHDICFNHDGSRQLMVSSGTAGAMSLAMHV